MAEEVGVAFVSLVPSARGFSRLAQRELRNELRGNGVPIPVTPEVDRNAVTAAFASITREPVLVRTDADTTTAGQTVRRELGGTAGERTGREFGDGWRRGADGRLRAARGAVEADGERTGRSTGQRVAQGVESGLAGFLPMALARPFEALGNNPVLSTIGIALGAPIAVAASSAIAAGISAAFMSAAGLGVIGLGAWLLREDPAIKAAATELGATAKSVFTQAASPLRGPFVQALEYLRGFVTEIGPDLKEMFAAVAPAIMPLTRGITGFIRAALPGFTALVKAATPLLQDLESTLPRLGKDIGTFFGLIAGSGPGASQFFRDLLNILGMLLTAIGIGITLFTTWYLSVRNAVTGIIDLLRMAVIGHKQNIEDIVGAFRWLRDQVLGAFSQIRGGSDSLVSFFRGVPGRIRSALGSTGNLLYQAGRNVIQGLINGIRSKFPSLSSVISQGVQMIRNHLPFSPAKVGPLSGSGNPFRSGQAIATMLAGGMKSQLPAVSSASSQLAGAVGFGASGARSAAGAAPAAQLGWAPDASGDRLLDAIREMIRVDFGGSVQAGLGTGGRA
ncbi:hypothetical protein ABZ814_13525 [Micromonospora musae]|uniref:phage tail protein n=1 Tax=Micromonospora musae TaxID=1894970 RepID=UPI0033D6004C